MWVTGCEGEREGERAREGCTCSCVNSSCWIRARFVWLKGASAFSCIRRTRLV